MKNYSLLLLAFFFSGSLFAQSSLDTAHDEDWTITNNMNCNSSPLTPAQIAALTFSTSIHHVCAGIVSPTGDEKIGPTNTSCLEPDLETRVFRGTHTFTSKPCLVTYNFSADNAFRIYVNGISSPTNVLSGTPANPPNPGLCGNNYSGNDWHVAFPGTLNIDDFGVGNNNIDFETQNGTEVEGEHPYWLAGKLIFWQFSDLNASLFPQIDIAAGQIFVKYQFTPQTNGALYSMRVEYTNSFPSNQNWVTHFIKTGTAKQFKISPNIPPVPTGCDFNGAAVRITFTAMAGDCHTSMIYNWNCGPGFNGGPNEQITQTTSNTDNPNFTLTPEQIKDIHDQFNEKLTTDNNLNLSLDSLFAASEGQSKLQVFPNPSNGHIWINTTEREDGPTPIKIFNQIGALVFEDRIQGRQEIDLSELPNGLYFLKSFEEKSGAINSTQFILQR